MGFMDNFNDEAGKTNFNGGQYRVMQVVLREKFVGKGSKNFTEIEEICNQQYAQGYRLHTFAQRQGRRLAGSLPLRAVRLAF